MPSLVTTRGVLTETPAMLLYIAQTYPDAALAPLADAWALAQVQAFKGPFVFGDAFTISDPYLFTIAQWWELDGVEPSRFPKLAAHRDRMRERPAVKRATQMELG